MTDSTPAKLRELLLNEFSEEELSALCASLDIDYDRLAGTGTFGKSRALIDTVKSQDKMRALQAKVRELRPAAYETASFATIQAPATMETPAATPAPTRQQTTPSNRTSLWPWLALALIVLLCTIAGMVLLLPRLQTASQPAANVTVPLTASTAQSIDAAPTETPPAIVEVTDSLDKGAGVLTGTEPAPQTNATAVGTTIAPTQSASTVAAIVITVTATPTPGGNAITPTTTATDTHPSIRVIRALNDQLPKFYTGEVDAQALQQHWTGEALRSVIAFGTVRLPRAMRIQPSQRNTIQATFEYRREPALVSATDDTAVVTTREFWRYANTVNATVICEVRDYVYNFLRVDGQFKVGTFNSRIVESGCSQ
jgi:hypothetical protein